MTESHIDGLASFVTASPSSFHAAEQAATRLVAAGFTRVSETQPFSPEPGGYVLLRDGSVVAWRVPRRAGEPSLRIVGAHTDSPGFVLKPRPTSEFLGWQQAGVEVYGGPLPNSWLDREFGLAGRLVTDDDTVLVATGPLLRIPQVAPHLDRGAHEKLVLDRQQHLHPVFAVARPDGDILSVVAMAAGLDLADVRGHDLCAFVTEPPSRFGLDGELFASPRLDNLASVHAGVTALAAVSDPDAVLVLACFDHEEVGSASASGAAGPLLETVLGRIADALGWTVQEAAAARARSLMVSADAGHAVHPNYSHLHDSGHRPLPNAGPLIKFNANQRYATDAIGAATWRRACAAAGVPTQDFVSSNSVPCGSTIGPLSATRLGIRTVDVGIPLLSMHSARELCGVHDPGWLAEGMRAFYAGS